ncbi:MAG: hypothetical protein WCQ67_08800 [Treponema sp.]
MNKKQSLFSRILIFVLGLGIIILAYYLFGSEGEKTDPQKFMWANIVVMYLVFFCPFFFSNVHTDNVDKKTPSLVTVWLGDIIFIIVALGLTIAIMNDVLQIRTAIIIEAILVFLFAIDIYFGYFGNTKIQEVGAHETQMLSAIKDIRSSMELLILKSSSLSSAYDDEKKKIASISEDARYLSPVENTNAVSLEQNMLGKITALSSACDSIASGSDGSDFKTQLSSLDMLMKQRKLLKN